jgi:hypothetical protein
LTAECFNGITTAASAAVVGSRLAKDPDIQTAVTDLLAQVGISKRTRAEQLAKLVLSNDLSIVGKGLELSYKLDRSFTDVVEHRVSMDDIRALQALIPDAPDIIDISPK